jgi:hypothetical protein
MSRIKVSETGGTARNERRLPPEAGVALPLREKGATRGQAKTSPGPHMTAYFPAGGLPTQELIPRFGCRGSKRDWPCQNLLLAQTPAVEGHWSNARPGNAEHKPSEISSALKRKR